MDDLNICESSQHTKFPPPTMARNSLKVTVVGGGGGGGVESKFSIQLSPKLNE